MGEKQPAVDEENLMEIDISAIALDERFGSLKFDNASKKLSTAQEYLNQAEELRFRELLLKDQINKIDAFRKNLIQHVQWLQNFDLGTNSNPKAEHDGFESRVDSFYNEIYRDLVMQYLPFLREERRRGNPQEKKLDEEVAQASQLRAELQEELQKVREESGKIRLTNKEVATEKGERAAKRLAEHFDGEAENYQSAAKKWYGYVCYSYVAIIVLIFFFGVRYWFWDAAFTWESAGAKLVLVAALWYGLSFLIRNYNVNSHLAAVNRHRAAVARTLEDFIVVEQQQENPRLAEMLQNATEAMFKHAPIGFISKAEKDNSSPLYEIVNNIVGSRSTQ